MLSGQFRVETNLGKEENDGRIYTRRLVTTSFGRQNGYLQFKYRCLNTKL